MEDYTLEETISIIEQLLETVTKEIDTIMIEGTFEIMEIPMMTQLWLKNKLDILNDELVNNQIDFLDDLDDLGF